MHTNTPLLAASFCPLLLAGCSDSDPKWDLLRDSTQVPTDEITLEVSAQTHLHIEATAEEDETHTTVVAEVYGYDRAGYYYNIALDEADSLVASQGDASMPMMAEYYPSEQQTAAVIYSADFDMIDALTEFSVTMTRANYDTPQSISVLLPDITPLTNTPSTPAFALSETLVVGWEEIEPYNYRLSFEFVCLDDQGERRRLRLNYPNSGTPNLNNPFSFNPSNYLAPEDNTEIVSCDLYTSLHSFYEQTPPEGAGVEEVRVYGQRQQTVIQALTF